MKMMNEKLKKKPSKQSVFTLAPFEAHRTDDRTLGSNITKHLLSVYIWG